MKSLIGEKMVKYLKSNDQIKREGLQAITTVKEESSKVSKTSIIVVLIYTVLMIIITSLMGTTFFAGVIPSVLIVIFGLIPLDYGVNVFFQNIYFKDKHEIKDLYSFYSKDNFSLKFLTCGLRLLWVVLFSIIIIVPGVIVYYSYSMVNILAERYPKLTAKEILSESKREMKGNRSKLFFFDLSFIGWFLLSALTLGIVFVLYVGPYYFSSRNRFLLDIFELNNLKITETEDGQLIYEKSNYSSLSDANL
jgi:uncharacterized membrane protein